MTGKIGDRLPRLPFQTGLLSFEIMAFGPMQIG
jgi:hypothetical protein